MYHIASSSKSKQLQFTLAKHFIHLLKKVEEKINLENLQKIFLELTIPFLYSKRPNRNTHYKVLIAQIPHHIWHKCRIEVLHKLPDLQNSYFKSRIYTSEVALQNSLYSSGNEHAYCLSQAGGH